MKVDWSAYRITLLLYMGIFLLPLSFYYSYSSFSEIQRDTKMLGAFSKNALNVVYYKKVSDITKKDKLKKDIDDTFVRLRGFVSKVDSDEFYISSASFLKDFDALVTCWDNVNKGKLDVDSYYKKNKSILFKLNNMLRLKQSKMYNLLYINLFVSMIIFVALVFFIRAYMYRQLSKNAVYDLKTNLYTKEYLIATLKSMSARVIRNDEILFAIYIDVKDLHYNNKDEDKILKHIGSTLLDSVRGSDIACRYSEHEFVIVLSNIDEENIVHIVNRLSDSLGSVEFDTKVVKHLKDESCEQFIARVV